LDLSLGGALFSFCRKERLGQTIPVPSSYDHKKISDIETSVAGPMCLSRIPGSECFPSRIRIKEFKYLNRKKWFLSFRKDDPGCSSQIRIPDPDFIFHRSPIPDTGVNGSRIHNTDRSNTGRVQAKPIGGTWYGNGTVPTKIKC
jgi:hypothetical protein